MLTYFVPSVVDISGAVIKRTVVISQEILKHKYKKKIVTFLIMLTHLFPSVVDMSGSGKKTQSSY